MWCLRAIMYIVSLICFYLICLSDLLLNHSRHRDTPRSTGNATARCRRRVSLTRRDWIHAALKFDAAEDSRWHALHFSQYVDVFRDLKLAERSSTRAARATPFAMVAEATHGVETRVRKRKRDLAAQAGVAFPGLPFDVAVSLVQKHLPDPADLAVLRAVSKGMRDAVDATGRKIEEFDADDAVERGYVSTLKCLRRRGRLSDDRFLCAAVARNGDLEELKALRLAGEFPVG